MEKFCQSLREQARNIIGFEKKKMFALTKEELKSHEDVKMLHLWKKNLTKAH